MLITVFDRSMEAYEQLLEAENKRRIKAEQDRRIKDVANPFGNIA